MRALIMSKVDLKKRFDRVTPEQCLEAASHMGMDQRVCDVARRFYRDHRRWLETEGVTHPVPARAQIGLLQGGPLSVLLLCIAMNVWVKEVKRASAGCIDGAEALNIGIYLDDRTFWARGPRAADTINVAARAGKELDDALKLSWHPDKCDSLCIENKLKGNALEELGWIGPITNSIELLRITYALNMKSASQLNRSKTQRSPSA